MRQTFIKIYYFHKTLRCGLPFLRSSDINHCIIEYNSHQLPFPRKAFVFINGEHERNLLVIPKHIILFQHSKKTVGFSLLLTNVISIHLTLQGHAQRVNLNRNSITLCFFIKKILFRIIMINLNVFGDSLLRILLILF